GALGRFNFGDDIVQALRTVVEVRQLGSRYVPGYFDTFYEVERWMMPAPKGTAVTDLKTKFEDVMAGRPQRFGYYLEQSYGIRGRIGLTLALEGTTQLGEKNFIAHLEVPAVDFLQFFGSYYKRGFTDFGKLTELDEQAIIFAGARLRLLPILAINARAF